MQLKFRGEPQRGDDWGASRRTRGCWACGDLGWSASGCRSARAVRLLALCVSTRKVPRTTASQPSAAR